MPERIACDFVSGSYNTAHQGSHKWIEWIASLFFSSSFLLIAFASGIDSYVVSAYGATGLEASPVLDTMYTCWGGTRPGPSLALAVSRWHVSCHAFPGGNASRSAAKGRCGQRVVAGSVTITTHQARPVCTYLVPRVVVLRLRAAHGVRLDELFVLLDLLAVHLSKQLHAELDVDDERVTSVLREVLADYNAQHLEVVRMRGHCVRRNDPATRTQFVCQGELVEMPVLVRDQPKSDQRQALARLLGHDDKPQKRQRFREVVGGAREVAHDGLVPLLPETDELVVLTDDLAGPLGEVEREGRLVCAEVVDVEHKLLREELGGPPDHPADPGVYQSVLSAYQYGARPLSDGRVPTL